MSVLLSDLYTGVKRMQLLQTSTVIESIYAVRTGTVNFYICKKDHFMICFDTGYGKNEIVRQLNLLNFYPKNISHIFLTHSDFDHAGGVSLFENAEIYFSSEEERMLREKKARMLGIYHNRAIKGKCRLLRDGDRIRIGEDVVRAVSTPGHTPGSMSYILNDSILFAGDTFRLKNGRVYPLRHYNMDTEMQKESIRKLASFNVQFAFTGHSGFTNNFQSAVADWRQP